MMELVWNPTGAIRTRSSASGVQEREIHTCQQQSAKKSTREKSISALTLSLREKETARETERERER